MEYNLDNRVIQKEKAIINMVKKGYHVPLGKVLSNKDIILLNITSHAIDRYKQRFKKLYDIQIEQDIKSLLTSSATIVDIGKMDRYLVYSKGYIFVLDRRCIYTVYDYNGNDRNNSLDDTKSKIFRIQQKTKYMDHLDRMFELAGLSS